jgi:O-acetyl-ADP-ribose deacetylase (regulator of RNase III)
MDIIAFLSKITPDTWAGGIAIGLISTAIASVLYSINNKIKPLVPWTPEGIIRLKEQEIADRVATQTNEVILVAERNGTQIKIFNGDITRSTADIIVSSDDTLLSATSGVAKKIVLIAGNKVRKQLQLIASTSVPRGAVAITSGGQSRYTYIVHAVVLTRTANGLEFPTKEEIGSLVRRIVGVAVATGAESIALPVLAGGTAAKKLREQGLKTNQDIIAFLLAEIVGALDQKGTSLREVFLITFNSEEINEGFLVKLRNQIPSVVGASPAYAQ